MGFTGDLEVGLMVDQLGEALTHDRVVVDQVDAFLDHDGPARWWNFHGILPEAGEPCKVPGESLWEK